MAFYDQAPQHIRQQSWDPSAGPGPGRQGPAASSHEEGMAFRAQFEEIDRAHENMAKSGRPIPPMHARRESLPMMGGPFMGQFPPDRMGPPRHHSISDYEQIRSSPNSGSLQGYLANQRFSAPRQNDAESMMQVKRRAAAQRERELRNYHQEQQYNRSMEHHARRADLGFDMLTLVKDQPGTNKSAERSISPNAMNEEDRRDLIARQHRALYGEGSNLHEGSGAGQQQRPISQDARVLAAAAAGVSAGNHSNSPLGFDSFNGQPSTSSAETGGASTTTTATTSAAPGQGSRSRSNSNSNSGNSKPANNSNNNASGNFGLYETGHNANRASSTSPGSSGQQQNGSNSAGGASGVGPIGSRVMQQSNVPKRNTPPVGSGNTPVSATNEKPGNLGWGSSNGPWGNTGKGSLGQTSVWG